MRPHHERAIRLLTEHFAQDPDCLAVIIGGSIAKGIERDDSDVDAMLLVTDERFRAQRAHGRLFYITGDFCDYPGGYIDAKYIDRAYLEAAAERGNEITRAAFTGALVTHAKVDWLDPLLARIAVFQPGERADKIAAFFAQFQCAYWYATEALRRGDRYLLTRSVADLVLFAGRLVLEHNGVLYPYHKHLLAALAGVADAPPGLAGMIDDVLARPDAATVDALYRAVMAFRAWDEGGQPWNERFLEDTEHAWLDGREPIADR